jgi:hypothetical protein
VSGLAGLAGLIERTLPTTRTASRRRSTPSSAAERGCRRGIEGLPLVARGSAAENFQVYHLLCPTCGLTLPQVLAWIVECMLGAPASEKPQQLGNNGSNGFGFAPGDDGPDGNGNWNSHQDPDNVETKAKATTKAVEQGTTTRTVAATPPARRHVELQAGCSRCPGRCILNPVEPVGGSRPPNPPSHPHPPPPTPTPQRAPSPRTNHAAPLPHRTEVIATSSDYIDDSYSKTATKLTTKKRERRERFTSSSARSRPLHGRTS